MWITAYVTLAVINGLIAGKYGVEFLNFRDSLWRIAR